MMEPTRLRELLNEYRFDDAEQLLADNTDPALAGEFAARRADAEKQAEVIVQRLVDLGAKGHLDEFLAVIDDPVNQRLAPLASPSARGRLELYVQEAERWRKHQAAVNARRLQEARQALEGLDLGLAEGLMTKLDARFLSDQGQQERDQLLLDMAARRMEIESLGRVGDKKKRAPARRKPRRRRR